MLLCFLRPKVDKRFSVQGQIKNILGSVEYTVLITASHFCGCSMEAAIDNTEWKSAPINTYLWKQWTDWFWPICHSLLTPVLGKYLEGPGLVIATE